MGQTSDISEGVKKQCVLVVVIFLGGGASPEHACAILCNSEEFILER